MSNTPRNSADLTLTTLSGHEDTIWGLAYLPGGKRVVTCSDDTTVRIWDVETGEQQGRSMEHEGGVYGLAVTRDGKRILSGGDDKSITVWDVETQEAIEEWGTHTSSIWCIAVSDSVDQLAASGDAYGKIVIKEMKEGGQIKQSIDAGNSVRSLCFSPNGEKLACAANEMDDGVHVVHVYDVESGELVLGPINHRKVVRCVLWSLDGNKLFSASDDRMIQCWDSKTGESIGQPWRGHDNYVTSLSVSPDGTKLASASADKTIRFWDARSGDPIERPLQHKSRIWAVTFSPASRSGEFVASGGSDKKVTIWHVPWWNEVITTFTYLRTPFLTVFAIATGTRSLSKPSRSKGSTSE
ncbi:WD40 repeat-like protein [Paxillus ammoniavirescens]|nr:WD40 repeat-like protein [Paxillus ammoniavirescens]